MGDCQAVRVRQTAGRRYDGQLRRSGQLIPLCRGLRTQGATHGVGVFGDNAQIGFRRFVGDVAILFPIAQRADRNMKLRSELFLRETQRAANDLGLRRALHAL